MSVSMSHWSMSGVYSLYWDCQREGIVMRLTPGMATIQVGAKYGELDGLTV